MKLPSLMKRTLGGLMALALAVASSLFGQGITTAAMSGFVSDKQGNAVPGATVTIVHEPTGTRTTTTTRANGQYNATGLRVGGPYTVSVSGGGLTAPPQKDL